MEGSWCRRGQHVTRLARIRTDEEMNFHWRGHLHCASHLSITRQLSNGANTIKAAYKIDPGVTFFMLFSSACGRLVFVLFGADRSSLADVGAVNICLKNCYWRITFACNSRFRNIALTRKSIKFLSRPLLGSSGSKPSWVAASADLNRVSELLLPESVGSDQWQRLTQINSLTRRGRHCSP